MVVNDKVEELRALISKLDGLGDEPDTASLLPIHRKLLDLGHSWQQKQPEVVKEQEHAGTTSITSFGASDLRLVDRLGHLLRRFDEGQQLEAVKAFPALRENVAQCMKSTTDDLNSWIGELRSDSGPGNRGEALLEAVLNTPQLRWYKECKDVGARVKFLVALGMALRLVEDAERQVERADANPTLRTLTKKLSNIFFEVKEHGNVLVKWLGARLERYGTAWGRAVELICKLKKAELQRRMAEAFHKACHRAEKEGEQKLLTVENVSKANGLSKKKKKLSLKKWPMVGCPMAAELTACLTEYAELLGKEQLAIADCPAHSLQPSTLRKLLQALDIFEVDEKDGPLGSVHCTEPRQRQESEDEESMKGASAEPRPKAAETHKIHNSHSTSVAVPAAASAAVAGAHPSSLRGGHGSSGGAMPKGQSRPMPKRRAIPLGLPPPLETKPVGTKPKAKAGTSMRVAQTIGNSSFSSGGPRRDQGTASPDTSLGRSPTSISDRKAVPLRSRAPRLASKPPELLLPSGGAAASGSSRGAGLGGRARSLSSTGTPRHRRRSRSRDGGSPARDEGSEGDEQLRAFQQRLNCKDATLLERLVRKGVMKDRRLEESWERFCDKRDIDPGMVQQPPLEDLAYFLERHLQEFFSWDWAHAMVAQSDDEAGGPPPPPPRQRRSREASPCCQRRSSNPVRQRRSSSPRRLRRSSSPRGQRRSSSPRCQRRSSSSRRKRSSSSRCQRQRLSSEAVQTPAPRAKRRAVPVHPCNIPEASPLPPARDRRGSSASSASALSRCFSRGEDGPAQVGKASQKYSSTRGSRGANSRSRRQRRDSRSPEMRKLSPDPSGEDRRSGGDAAVAGKTADKEHSKGEKQKKRKRDDDDPFYRTRPCTEYMRTGKCELGRRCYYAHSVEELRSSAEMMQMMNMTSMMSMPMMMGNHMATMMGMNPSMMHMMQGKVASSSGKEKARGSKHRRQEDKDVASLASRAAMETAIDADDL